MDKKEAVSAEILDFLKNNKRWWLTPIVISMLIIGILILFGQGPNATPFIYMLF